MRNQNYSQIKFLPGMAIFTEIGVLVVAMFLIINIYHGIITSGKSLQNFIVFGVFILFLMSLSLLFHYFFYSIPNFNLQSKLVLYSHFTKKEYDWNQINSINCIIANPASAISSSHGFIFIFLMPYFFNTRMVRFCINISNKKEEVFWLRLNLGNVNKLFQLFDISDKFVINHEMIDFARMKGKKYRNPIRHQWIFHNKQIYNPSESNLGYSFNFYIKNSTGDRLNEYYSSQAKWMQRLGYFSLFLLLSIWGLLSFNFTFSIHSKLWIIILAITSSSFISCLILSFFTPELRRKPTFFV